MNKYIGKNMQLVGPITLPIPEPVKTENYYNRGGFGMEMYYMDKMHFNTDSKEFQEHIASLPSMQCEGWTPVNDLFYTEGVHFEQDEQFWEGSSWWSTKHVVDRKVKPGTQIRVVAVQLPLPAPVYNPNDPQQTSPAVPAAPQGKKNIICRYTNLMCNTGYCTEDTCSILEVMKHKDGQPFTINHNHEEGAAYLQPVPAALQECAHVQKSPWPLLGYAPGSYSNTCANCGTEMINVDKLCFQCLECAVKSANKIMGQYNEKASADDKNPPWFLLGYAPGNHSNECSNCGVTMMGVDKLSHQCLSCAVKAANRMMNQPDHGYQNELPIEGSKASDVSDESLFIKGWQELYVNWYKLYPTEKEQIEWISANIINPMKSQIAGYRFITKNLIERRNELLATRYPEEFIVWTRRCRYSPTLKEWQHIGTGKIYKDVSELYAGPYQEYVKELNNEKK